MMGQALEQLVFLKVAQLDVHGIQILKILVLKLKGMLRMEKKVSMGKNIL